MKSTNSAFKQFCKYLMQCRTQKEDSAETKLALASLACLTQSNTQQVKIFKNIARQKPLRDLGSKQA
jgi:hypothetical protein